MSVMEKYIKTHTNKTRYIGVKYHKHMFIIKTEGIVYQLNISKKENANKKRKVNIYAITQWCTDYIRLYMESKETDSVLTIDEIISIVRVQYGMIVTVTEYKEEGVIA